MQHDSLKNPKDFQDVYCTVNNNPQPVNLFLVTLWIKYYFIHCMKCLSIFTLFKQYEELLHIWSKNLEAITLLTTEIFF